MMKLVLVIPVLAMDGANDEDVSKIRIEGEILIGDNGEVAADLNLAVDDEHHKVAQLKSIISYSNSFVDIGKLVESESIPVPQVFLIKPAASEEAAKKADAA